MPVMAEDAALVADVGEMNSGECDIDATLSRGMVGCNVAATCGSGSMPNARDEVIPAELAGREAERGAEGRGGGIDASSGTEAEGGAEASGWAE